MGSLPPRPAPLFLGARGLWVPQLSAWLLCTDAGAALLGVTHKPVRVGAGARPVFSPTFPVPAAGSPVPVPPLSSALVTGVGSEPPCLGLDLWTRASDGEAARGCGA